MNRQAFLEAAATESFDVCIIGGGATGAGAALDAASRGLKTILIEKVDFGAATSSKSTKLIHGGVRYLEQAVKKLSPEQYGMVRKALQERSTLLRLAPHITRPLQLLTPCRTWIEGLYYWIGLKLYDYISGRVKVGGGSELLRLQKTLEKIPTLRKDKLFTSVVYYDGQLDDQRYNLALIQTACRHGAICINHLAATAFGYNNHGQLETVQVRDMLTQQVFTIRAGVFVNATGPFADTIRLMANSQLAPRMRVSRGVHILLPKHMMPSQSALLIPQTADGRLIFAIPYQKHLLVGTTDDEAVLTDETFGPTAAEVDYLLHYINEYLDVQATPKDVLAGFGGLRPLVMKGGGDTKDLVRDHEVEMDPQSGLVSILGGKWTTYRLMAKDTVDEVCRLRQIKTECTTQNIVLAGSEHYDHTTPIRLQQQTGWDHELVKHLVSKYGDAAFDIAALAAADEAVNNRLLPALPYTLAELQYVVQHEMALTLDDVLNRRWGSELANWKQTLELATAVAPAMAALLNWTTRETSEALQAYRNHLNGMIKVAGLQHLLA